MFGAWLYMAQISGHYENWGASIWRALKCVLEENGEDKMARESN